MTELKTLNDFAIEWGDGFGVVRKDELRDEAIKWIKELEKEFNNKVLSIDNSINPSIIRFSKEIKDFTISNFINFFNITDEDLSSDTSQK